MRIEARGGTLSGGNKKTRNPEALSSNEASWTGAGWPAACQGHGRERAGQGTLGPHSPRCSKTPEQHGWEKCELFCVFLSSLTSHLHDATEVTHVGRQAVTCMENSQKWRRKRSLRTKEESQPPPHPQPLDCVPRLLRAGICSHSRSGGWSKNSKHAR